jgi:hypothetical protein
MPVSANAILRRLKGHVRERLDVAPLRAVAIDDWSWRKGFTYATIIIDLERPIVADAIETRSAKETANCSSGLLKSKSSAATAAGSTHKASGKARRKPGKSPTALIRCRTCPKASSGR